LNWDSLRSCGDVPIVSNSRFVMICQCDVLRKLQLLFQTSKLPNPSDFDRSNSLDPWACRWATNSWSKLGQIRDALFFFKIYILYIYMYYIYIPRLFVELCILKITSTAKLCQSQYSVINCFVPRNQRTSKVVWFGCTDPQLSVEVRSSTVEFLRIWPPNVWTTVWRFG
jgi:hypothetical protein